MPEDVVVPMVEVEDGEEEVVGDTVDSEAVEFEGADDVIILELVE